MRRPARGTRPHAAPAQPSPQLAQSPSPLGHVAFGSKKHPARSSRASLPRFERAHSGKAVIGQACGMAGRSGGRAGRGSSRASGCAGGHCGEGGRYGERAGGRPGAWAAGRVGWGEGQQWGKLSMRASTRGSERADMQSRRNQPSEGAGGRASASSNDCSVSATNCSTLRGELGSIGPTTIKLGSQLGIVRGYIVNVFVDDRC